MLAIQIFGLLIGVALLVGEVLLAVLVFIKLSHLENTNTEEEFSKYEDELEPHEEFLDDEESTDDEEEYRENLSETIKLYYTEDTITRPVLINLLESNGKRGVKKLRKEELLQLVNEMHIPLPEIEK